MEPEIPPAVEVRRVVLDGYQEWGRTPGQTPLESPHEDPLPDKRASISFAFDRQKEAGIKMRGSLAHLEYDVEAAKKMVKKGIGEEIEQRKKEREAKKAQDQTPWLTTDVRGQPLADSRNAVATPLLASRPRRLKISRVREDLPRVPPAAGEGGGGGGGGGDRLPPKAALVGRRADAAAAAADPGLPRRDPAVAAAQARAAARAAGLPAPGPSGGLGPGSGSGSPGSSMPRGGAAAAAAEGGGSGSAAAAAHEAAARRASRQSVASRDARAAAARGLRGRLAAGGPLPPWKEEQLAAAGLRLQGPPPGAGGAGGPSPLAIPGGGGGGPSPWGAAPGSPTFSPDVTLSEFTTARRPSGASGAPPRPRSGSPALRPSASAFPLAFAASGPPSPGPPPPAAAAALGARPRPPTAPEERPPPPRAKRRPPPNKDLVAVLAALSQPAAAAAAPAPAPAAAPPAPAAAHEDGFGATRWDPRRGGGSASGLLGGPRAGAAKKRLRRVGGRATLSASHSGGTLLGAPSPGGGWGGGPAGGGRLGASSRPGTSASLTGGAQNRLAASAPTLAGAAAEEGPLGSWSEATDIMGRTAQALGLGGRVPVAQRASTAAAAGPRAAGFRPPAALVEDVARARAALAGPQLPPRAATALERTTGRNWPVRSERELAEQAERARRAEEDKARFARRAAELAEKTAAARARAAAEAKERRRAAVEARLRGDMDGSGGGGGGEGPGEADDPVAEYKHRRARRMWKQAVKASQQVEQYKKLTMPALNRRSKLKGLQKVAQAAVGQGVYFAWPVLQKAFGVAVCTLPVPDEEHLTLYVEPRKDNPGKELTMFRFKAVLAESGAVRPDEAEKLVAGSEKLRHGDMPKLTYRMVYEAFWPEAEHREKYDAELLRKRKWEQEQQELEEKRMEEYEKKMVAKRKWAIDEMKQNFKILHLPTKHSRMDYRKKRVMKHIMERSARKTLKRMDSQGTVDTFAQEIDQDYLQPDWAMLGVHVPLRRGVRRQLVEAVKYGLSMYGFSAQESCQMFQNYCTARIQALYRGHAYRRKAKELELLMKVTEMAKRNRQRTQERLLTSVFDGWYAVIAHQITVRAHCSRRFFLWKKYYLVKRKKEDLMSYCLWPIHIWRRHTARKLCARDKATTLARVWRAYWQLRHFRAWGRLARRSNEPLRRALGFERRRAARRAPSVLEVWHLWAAKKRHRRRCYLREGFKVRLRADRRARRDALLGWRWLTVCRRALRRRVCKHFRSFFILADQRRRQMIKMRAEQEEHDHENGLGEIREDDEEEEAPGGAASAEDGSSVVSDMDPEHFGASYRSGGTALSSPGSGGGGGGSAGVEATIGGPRPAAPGAAGGGGLSSGGGSRGRAGGGGGGRGRGRRRSSLSSRSRSRRKSAKKKKKDKETSLDDIKVEVLGGGVPEVPLFPRADLAPGWAERDDLPDHLLEAFDAVSEECREKEDAQMKENWLKYRRCAPLLLHRLIENVQERRKARYARFHAAKALKRWAFHAFREAVVEEQAQDELRNNKRKYAKQGGGGGGAQDGQGGGGARASAKTKQSLLARKLQKISNLMALGNKELTQLERDRAQREQDADLAQTQLRASLNLLEKHKAGVVRDVKHDGRFLFARQKEADALRQFMDKVSLGTNLADAQAQKFASEFSLYAAQLLLDACYKVYGDYMQFIRKRLLRVTLRMLRLPALDRKVRRLCNLRRLRNWLRLCRRLQAFDRGMPLYRRLRTQWVCFNRLIEMVEERYKYTTPGLAKDAKRRRGHLQKLGAHLTEDLALEQKTHNYKDLQEVAFSTRACFYSLLHYKEQNFMFAQLARAARELHRTAFLQRAFYCLRDRLPPSSTWPVRRSCPPFGLLRARADLLAVRSRLLGPHRRDPATRIRGLNRQALWRLRLSALEGPSFKKFLGEFEARCRHRAAAEQRLLVEAFHARGRLTYTDQVKDEYLAGPNNLRGATSFKDVELPGAYLISEIHLITRPSQGLVGLWFVAKGGDNACTLRARGVLSGKEEVFRLRCPEERLVQIEAMCSTVLERCRFLTSTGRWSRWFGERLSSQVDRSLLPPAVRPGEYIAGLIGYETNLRVIALGVVVRKVVKSDLFSYYWAEQFRGDDDNPEEDEDSVLKDLKDGARTKKRVPRPIGGGGGKAFGGGGGAAAAPNQAAVVAASTPEMEFAAILRMRTSDIYSAMYRALAFARRVWSDPGINLRWDMAGIRKLRIIEQLTRWLFDAVCWRLVPHVPHTEEIEKCIEEGREKVLQGKHMQSTATLQKRRAEYVQTQPVAWKRRGLLSPADRRQEKEFQAKIKAWLEEAERMREEGQMLIDQGKFTTERALAQLPQLDQSPENIAYYSEKLKVAKTQLQLEASLGAGVFRDGLQALGGGGGGGGGRKMPGALEGEVFGTVTRALRKRLLDEARERASQENWTAGDGASTVSAEELLRDLERLRRGTAGRAGTAADGRRPGSQQRGRAAGKGGGGTTRGHTNNKRRPTTADSEYSLPEIV